MSSRQSKSVISAQSQPKSQFSKPSSTVVSTGGAPVPHRVPLASAGWGGSDAVAIPLHTALRIKNQVYDCGRALIDSKKRNDIFLEKKIVKNTQKAGRGNKMTSR